MVRRWSYLNYLNTTSLQTKVYNHKPLLSAHHTTIFKATTHYRRKLYKQELTKLVRKSFFRRRHLHGWLIYQNILVSWARDYLFFRRYSRILLGLNTYKNNYLIHNVLIFKNLHMGDLINFSHFSVTNLVKNVTKYCLLGGTHLFAFTRWYTDVSWFYISSPYNNILLKKLFPKAEEPLYHLYQGQLAALGKKKQVNNVIELLLQLLHKASLAKTIELYKIFILCSISNLFE